MSRHADWIYRGGHSALCLYAESGPHAGAAMATEHFRADAPERLLERVPSGAGTLLTSADGWRFAPEVFDGAALAWLEAMQGEAVRALVVARGMGRHVRWREDVPVLLDRTGGAAGTLAGARLLLETRLFGADVSEYPDLLAPGVFEDGGAWTAESAGAGSGWAVATDPLTGLPGVAYDLHADAGTTATIHAQAVLPAVGALGPSIPGEPGRLPLAFVCRLSGVADVLATGATVRLTLTALSYADRAATQASVLSAATTPEARSVEPVPFGNGSDPQDEDVRMTYPEGAWVARVALEVTASGGGASGAVRLAAPSLLTRAPNGSTLTPGGARAGVSGLKMAPDGTTLYVYDPASVTGSTDYRHTIVVPADAVIGGCPPALLGD